MQSSFQGFLMPRPNKKGVGSLIKSIQRGETNNNSAATSFTATIPIAVDLTKAIVIAFVQSANQPQAAGSMIRASITSPTQITFTKGGAVASIVTVTWQVIELSGLKSFQSGNTALPQASTSATATVNIVDPSKSIVFASASSDFTGTTSGITPAIFGSTLTNSTTITFTHSGSGNKSVDWFLVEFN